jgi:hypothetical protein
VLTGLGINGGNFVWKGILARGEKLEASGAILTNIAINIFIYFFNIKDI